MADATSLPTSTQLHYFDWGDVHFTKNPAIDGSGTYTLEWSKQPLDKDGAIITGAFLVTSTARSGEPYTFFVPAAKVSADGLSATECVGGIRPTGLDYTTGDSDFEPTSDTILSGRKITCGIPATLVELIRSSVQGGIRTGGVTFDIGTGATEDVYIKHNGSPWLKQTSAGVAQYYNGSSYVALNDSIASSLVKASATDTTPDYLYGKLGSSDSSVTISVTGGGSDETVNLAVNMPARISSHAVYTPAYMTGGTSAESNVAIWDSVTDGSFRLTLDGVTLNVTGINFTGVTTMAQVASTIQTALRTACGTTPTVVWSTNKFIITSSVTTSSSAVSVLTTSTASVGTDISGVGTVYMDAESGRGTATAAVLDPTQDAGKIDILDSNGQHKKEFLKYAVDQTNGYGAAGSMQIATGADTPANFNVSSTDDQVIVSDSTQSQKVRWQNLRGVGSHGLQLISYPLLGAIGADLGFNSYRNGAGTGSIINLLVSNNGPFSQTTILTFSLTRFVLEFSFAFTGTASTAKVGLGSVTTRFETAYNSANNGFIGIAWDGATSLYAVNANGSNTNTLIDSGYAANEKRLIRIEYTASQILFYMNNATSPVATHTTNIPTIAPDSSTWGWGSGGTGAGTHGEVIMMPNISLLASDFYTT